MKLLLLLSVVCLSFPGQQLRAQGSFFAVNGFAPTRVGSADGPLAGPGIWGQFFAGSSLDALLPFGFSVEHRRAGFASLGILSVPGIPPGDLAYIQFVAWDGNAWGAALEGVPVDQLGRTDIAAVGLTGEPLPIPEQAPWFNQPAIVPPVPEPSTWALLLLAAGALISWAMKRPLL